MASGVAAGALCGMGVSCCALWCWRDGLLEWLEQQLVQRKVARMPSRIILVRHGESEANVDSNVWNCKPDHMIELTDRGCEQAREAGARIKQLIGDAKAVAVISPFWRANMTMRNIHKLLPGQVVETRIEPRVREQEFGNFQDADKMREYRRIRNQVGRFYYRFPEGESGADVYNRAAACLQSLKTLNTHRTSHIDNVIVVTHGLAMRLMLCAEMSWSPDTFNTIDNPSNCEFWVLKKKPDGRYEISDEGSRPVAQRHVHVHYLDGRVEEHCIPNYLDIPQPRTLYPEVALQQLGLDSTEVRYIDYWCGAYTKTD